MPLYHEVRGWFVTEGKGRSLHAFLKSQGYELRTARDVLAGTNRGERSRELRKLLRQETGIPIPVDAA